MSMIWFPIFTWFPTASLPSHPRRPQRKNFIPFIRPHPRVHCRAATDIIIIFSEINPLRTKRSERTLPNIRSASSAGSTIPKRWWSSTSAETPLLTHYLLLMPEKAAIGRDAVGNHVNIGNQRIAIHIAVQFLRIGLVHVRARSCIRIIETLKYAIIYKA